MSRILAVLICMLAVILAAAFVGCRNDGPSGDEPIDVTAPTDAPDTAADEPTPAPTLSPGQPTKRETEPPVATPDVNDPIPGSILAADLPVSVKAEDCFETGFCVIRVGEDLELSADFGSDRPAGWRIFVLDSEYGRAPLELLRERNPILTESGSLSVTRGQYIYVYCPVNSNNSDAAPDCDPLTLSAN